MFESIDNEYIQEKNIQKLNRAYLAIPGFHMFAKADIRKAEVPLDEHFHHNRFEFVIPLKGTQEYVIGPDSYQISGGDVFVTFPDEVHGNNSAPQNICSFLWFQLDISDPLNFFGLSAPFSDILYQKLRNYKNRITKITPGDTALLSRAFSCFCSENKNDWLLGHSLFLAFLNILLFTDPKKPEITADMQQVLNYIHSHIDSSLDFTTLAKIGHLSVSHLKSKFKEQTGITPREYINHLKIDRSKELLLHSSYSITEIAFRLDFSSSNYFASVFRQFTGYTPSEYKKRFSSVINTCET